MMDRKRRARVPRRDVYDHPQPAQERSVLSHIRTAFVAVGVLALLSGSTRAQIQLERGCSPPPPGAKLWSDPATWGGSIPGAGSSVVVPAGVTIVLDVPPAPLKQLSVEGTLLFGCGDFNLACDRIEVSGALHIGSQAHPHLHRAEIVLGNQFHPAADPLAKTFLVQTGGVLEMHGEPRSHSWLHLAATAWAGDSTLVLEEPVDWRRGERLVLASTDFDQYQAEELLIRSVSNGGTNLHLVSPLTYTHWGEIEQGVLDERAEVALLDRNVTVRGDQDSVSTQIGGHMLFEGLNSAEIHLEWIELERMGQAGQLARYPLHYHLVGDASGSYVRNCSIHHCYNRSLTIHGTHNVEVRGNVSYDTLGHAFFLEDSTETGNRFIDNLGLLTRRPAPEYQLLPSDAEPSTYWISNTDNQFIGNVAAGSAYHGFQYDIPKENWSDVKPPVFVGNVAHSNGGHGFFLNDHLHLSGPARFPNFTAYKNRESGIWCRLFGRATWTHAAVGDNRTGVYLASGGFAKDGFAFLDMIDSFVIGESNNVGNPQTAVEINYGRCLPDPSYPSQTITGYEFYDGLLSVSNTTFAFFRSVRIAGQVRHAAALGPVFFDNPWAIDPRNYSRNLSFFHAQRVYIKAPSTKASGIASTTVYDQDGSLTGTADQYVAASTPLMTPASGYTFEPVWNAIIVPGPATPPHHFAYGQLTFVDRTKSAIQFVRVDSIDRGGGRDIYDPAFSSPNHKVGSETFRFPTSLLLNESYAISVPVGAIREFDLELRFGPPQSAAVLKIAYATPGPAEVRVNSVPVTQAPDLGSLRTGDGNSYFYDAVGQSLYLKAVVRGQGSGPMQGRQTIIEVIQP